MTEAPDAWLHLVCGKAEIPPGAVALPEGDEHAETAALLDSCAPSGIHALLAGFAGLERLSVFYRAWKHSRETGKAVYVDLGDDPNTYFDWFRRTQGPGQLAAVIDAVVPRV